ncbi:MAG: hypothetical protein H6R04_1024 [Burkholderiaceae bacterium]|nr:hypothetical protein [Burkholderiaceae bacterium]
MRQRIFNGCLLAWMAFSSTAFAGDDATFRSLGWSPDSARYAFAQYGYQDGSGFPYASGHVIDTASNRYVRHGTAEIVQKNAERKNTDALAQLLSIMRGPLRTAGIDARQPVATPIVPRCAVTQDEAISVCTFDSPRHGPLTLTLKQQSTVAEEPTSDETNASFSLQLEGAGIQPLLLEDGRTRRVRVLDYHIKEIHFSPDGQHIAVIVQKREAAFEGPSTRYMAEVGRIIKNR